MGQMGDACLTLKKMGGGFCQFLPIKTTNILIWFALIEHVREEIFSCLINKHGVPHHSTKFCKAL